MNHEAEPTRRVSPTLASVLTAYFAAPGKYQLSLRQPSVLFGSVREILHIAAGRTQFVDGAGEHGPELREAARFFVRAALLYPGADHYAVLGFPAGAQAGDLKERYRLLMRLIHPDFSQGAQDSWPDDAAVRVNRAYEVLSTPRLRREYDEKLGATKVKAALPKAARPPAVARAPKLHLRRGRAWTIGLILSLPSILLLLPREERNHLVQRPVAGRSAAQEPHGVQEAPVAPPSAETILEPVSTEPEPLPPVEASQPIPLPTLIRPPAAPGAATKFTVLALPAHTSAAPIRRMDGASEPLPRLAPVQNTAVREEPAPAPLFPYPPVPPESRPLVPAAPPLHAAASTVPAPALLLAKTSPELAAPSMADVQPQITVLLQAFESGRADHLLQLLADRQKAPPESVALVGAFREITGGKYPVRLSHVEFASQARDGVLVVTGSMRLHAGEPTIGDPGQPLLFRAEFVQRAGNVQLARLSGRRD